MQRSGSGGGGVGRGPGDAPLLTDNDAQGGVGEAMPLPPGQAPPEDWVPIGSRRSAPDVDPQRATGPGGAGDAGRAGASWQLRVAPRHRAVVQRFFGDGGERRR